MAEKKPLRKYFFCFINQFHVPCLILHTYTCVYKRVCVCVYTINVYIVNQVKPEFVSLSL